MKLIILGFIQPVLGLRNSPHTNVHNEAHILPLAGHPRRTSSSEIFEAKSLL